MIWQQFKNNICAFQCSKDFWVCANIKCAFTSPTLCYDANWGIFSCVSIRNGVDSRNLNPIFWHVDEKKDLNKEITWLSTLLWNLKRYSDFGQGHSENDIEMYKWFFKSTDNEGLGVMRVCFSLVECIHNMCVCLCSLKPEELTLLMGKTEYQTLIPSIITFFFPCSTLQKTGKIHNF